MAAFPVRRNRNGQDARCPSAAARNCLKYVRANRVVPLRVRAMGVGTGRERVGINGVFESVAVEVERKRRGEVFRAVGVAVVKRPVVEYLSLEVDEVGVRTGVESSDPRNDARV